MGKSHRLEKIPLINSQWLLRKPQIIFKRLLVFAIPGPVNANELCTKATWDPADSEYVSYVGVDYTGDEISLLITNKDIKTLNITYIYTPCFIKKQPGT